MVEKVGREHGIRFPMQGTMALSDGATIWAFRYSTQGRSRTLFHSVDIDTLREMYPDAERLKLFGRHAHVVVSEPLNDLPGAFVEVPESTVAILDDDRVPPRAVHGGSGVAAESSSRTRTSGCPVGDIRSFRVLRAALALRAADSSRDHSSRSAAASKTVLERTSRLRRA